MADLALQLGLAFLLSITQYVAEAFADRLEKFHDQFLSFSAGIFLAFLFLVLIPQTVKLEPLSQLFIFIGFVGAHALQKYLYQHSHPADTGKKIGQVDAAGFFAIHLVEGIALVASFSISPRFGLLIFIPLLVSGFSSSTLLAHVLEMLKVKSDLPKFVITFSTVLGAVLALTLPIGNLLGPLFALTVGALFYIVVRDMLPKGVRGDLSAFLAGCVLGLAIVLGFALY